MMSFIRLWALQTTATIMIAFAIMAPVLIGAAGMALDFAQAHLVRERLSHALDSAALAAAASGLGGEELQGVLERFFAANYPPDKLGFTYNLQFTIEGDEVYVSANADYTTFFLNVIGMDSITVFSSTRVKRQLRGLEVVLVLDNTGSMSANNNIEALKNGTRDFINILFSATSTPTDIKIGLVPYANAVRVGRYGLGRNPDNTVYADGRSFVNLPAGFTYTTNANHSSASQWFGCVIEHEAGGWNPSINNNDPYPDDVLDEYEGPWSIYRYEQWNNSQSQYVVSSRPATNCPRSLIVPMTSDKAKLLAAVNTMTPHGNTLGNIGMTWGYRMISPEFPFEEAAPWDDVNWRKAVILMTDGDNTRDTHYSAYWRSRNNQVSVTNYNQRMVETCQALKDQGVRVYTVTFTSGISQNTKNFYRNCATDPTYYHDAPDQDELVRVFREISNELANLHITQ